MPLYEYELCEGDCKVCGGSSRRTIRSRTLFALVDGKVKFDKNSRRVNVVAAAAAAKN